MKAEPGLVQFVKELPREQLERKFCSAKCGTSNRSTVMTQRSKPGSRSPNRPSWSRASKATISPEMKPEQQAQALVNQAKNYIRNTGIKIS